MAQMYTVTWTNPAAAAAKDFEIGFNPAHIIVMGLSGTTARSEWNDQMPDASFYNSKTDAYTTTNGFTPIDQTNSATFGSAVSGFTNANPGVITVADGSLFEAGDVINVTQLADDGTATTLNGQYTIASISGNALTTGTNTTAYSVYVSGGRAYVYQHDGETVATENTSIIGVRLGTSVVGANSQVMTMTVWGKNMVT